MNETEQCSSVGTLAKNRFPSGTGSKHTTVKWATVHLLGFFPFVYVPLHCTRRKYHKIKVKTLSLGLCVLCLMFTGHKECF